MGTSTTWVILSSVESGLHYQRGTAHYDPERIWLDISQRARRAFGRAEYLRSSKDGTLGLIGLEHPEVGDTIAIGDEELLRTILNCRHMVVDASGALCITAEENSRPASTPWRVCANAPILRRL